MRARRAAILRCLAIAPCLALACGETDAPIESAPAVLVAPVVVERVRERIEATGELRARSRARVAAQVEGQVTWVHPREGAALAEGERVVAIDPERRELEHRDQAAGLAEAQVERDEAERELRRVERLHGQGVASQALLDGARSAVRRSRARRDAAAARLGMTERALRDSNVTAPFAGMLVRRLVNEGEFVTVGDGLFEVVALDPLEVEFHVAERDSSRIAPEAALEVRLAPHPDEVFPASVSVLSPTIEPASRTLRVKGIVPNPDGRLRPGLFAHVTVDLGGSAPVPLVPREAVLQRAEGTVVFVLREPDRAERRVVRLGAFHGERVEVVEGALPGERILVRGHARLVDGARVSLRDAEGRPLRVPAGSAADLARGDAPAAQVVP